MVGETRQMGCLRENPPLIRSLGSDMSPFKRTRRPMFRYGESDFDRHYVDWGMHKPEVQRQEAESLLRLLPASDPLRILDLACGVGTHAVVWAEQGHVVTGVDLSETFISMARDTCLQRKVAVDLFSSDIRNLNYENDFDLVTWIERSFFDESIVESVFRSLRPGGAFIFDDRNPENPKVRTRLSDWRDWREENGTFFLERHETNPETGVHENVWITIDPESETIEERVGDSFALQSLDDRMSILKHVGFQRVELKEMNGACFTGGPEPSWLWVVAKK